MALTDFFRINMPYGMRKNENGEWFTFNREYIPLGWNTDKIINAEEYPVYTAYKSLTEKKLEEIAGTTGYVQRDEKGNICILFFYNDETNPASNPRYWNEYFEKIKALSKLKVKSSY